MTTTKTVILDNDDISALRQTAHILTELSMNRSWSPDELKALACGNTCNDTALPTFNNTVVEISFNPLAD